MGRRRLLTLTLWALAGFAVLIGLGTWQIERLHWKDALIAERAAAVSAPPAELPRTPDAARPLDFRRVQVKGVFLHDHEIPVHAIERRSGAAGYLVLTPLRLEDGAVVLVERGWVPDDKREAATRAEGNPLGEVAVEGLLRWALAEKPGWFVPANDPGRGEWFWIDLPALARAAGVPEALPFYVEAGPAPNPGGLPVGGQANTDLPNDHLQYAITWYALAAALAVIYFLVLRRERAAASQPTEQP
ncbi:MAG TPA: SURF1 family protein [Stellaceae bacterium]|nr:SURF1 family protein [Stellaceae bacterium]